MSMIHDITSRAPRNKKGIRKGRGAGTGRGKTAGRGTKGAGAHGGDVHWIPGREGGQTPLFRRFPKRGFSNVNFANKYHIVNLSDLNQFDDGATVDQAALIDAGLVPDDKLPVKVLGDGTLTKKLTTQAKWYSKSAHEKIGAAGGVAHDAKGEVFEFPKPKKKFIKREPQKKARTPAEGEAEPAPTSSEPIPASSAPAASAPASTAAPATDAQAAPAQSEPAQPAPSAEANGADGSDGGESDGGGSDGGGSDADAGGSSPSA